MDLISGVCKAQERLGSDTEGGRAGAPGEALGVYHREHKVRVEAALGS